MNILNSVREKPVKDTNDKYVILYKSKCKVKNNIFCKECLQSFLLYLLECWQYEPYKRLNIQQVILELNLINTENNNVSTPKKGDANEDLYLPD